MEGRIHGNKFRNWCFAQQHWGRSLDRTGSINAQCIKTLPSKKFHRHHFIVMNVDFKKYKDGLVPAIIQDFATHKVLMLGFMNEEAFHKTETSGKVTFYSR